MRLIEIELFSYCNRKCSFCPNSYIDRQSNIKYLDKNILISLLKELKQLNYKGYFSFSRYNEPFSNFKYLNENIQLIKEYFPESIMVSNTNGDFITEEIIKEMLIDELTIMDYDNKGKIYGINFLKNMHIINIKEYNNYLVGEYNNKKILYYYDWKEKANFSDRGGNLSKYSLQIRKFSCYEPLYFLGINYDGTVSPCCNIRNDCKNQKKYILGDLHNQTLKEILDSKKYKDFIKKNINKNYTKNMPCYYCNNTGGRYTKDKGSILYE